MSDPLLSFLDQVVAQLPAGQARDVRHELQDHLDCLIEEGCKRGLSLAASQQAALHRMGDAGLLGQMLQRVSRRTARLLVAQRLLLSLGIMVAMGLISHAPSPLSLLEVMAGATLGVTVLAGLIWRSCRPWIPSVSMMLALAAAGLWYAATLDNVSTIGASVAFGIMSCTYFSLMIGLWQRPPVGSPRQIAAWTIALPMLIWPAFFLHVSWIVHSGYQDKLAPSFLPHALAPYLLTASAVALVILMVLALDRGMLRAFAHLDRQLLAISVGAILSLALAIATFRDWQEVYWAQGMMHILPFVVAWFASRGMGFPHRQPAETPAARRRSRTSRRLVPYAQRVAIGTAMMRSSSS